MNDIATASAPELLKKPAQWSVAYVKDIVRSYLDSHWEKGLDALKSDERNMIEAISRGLVIRESGWKREYLENVVQYYGSPYALRLSLIVLEKTRRIRSQEGYGKEIEGLLEKQAEEKEKLLTLKRNIGFITVKPVEYLHMIAGGADVEPQVGSYYVTLTNKRTYEDTINILIIHTRYAYQGVALTRLAALTSAELQKQFNERQGVWHG